MKKYMLILATLAATTLFAQQTLNNPVGTDGCYIVRWNCQSNSFAASNDFEADETFTFAIDVTGTQWETWLAQPGTNGTRGIATNFSTDQGQQVRHGDRLFHIQGNIYGKTINLSQLSAVNLSLTANSQLIVYSNLFGFEYTAENAGAGWYINPSQDILPDGNCFFKTAPYTGTHACPAFTSLDYGTNIYGIDQSGYAVPCVIDEPCYSGSTPVNPDPEPVIPTPEPVEGSHVYPFPSDAQHHGYYNRPYERYEAEPDFCSTNGSFLPASDDQRDLQSEASHQQAVQLTAQNQYVSWVVNQPGDGLTIRFSLPDNSNGTGTTGTLAVYAGNDHVGTLNLNSYWAWQYTTNGGNYPTNTPVTPGSGNVVRMRFDETHIRLSRAVNSGETLRLVKTDNNSTPYTIDFVELEPVPAKVTYESLSGNKVQFTGGDIADFVNANQGKIIYVPEGRWETGQRIYLNADGTQLIGAGMWYTEIYFNASSDNSSTYSKRGIESYNSNLRIEGLYLNTINNKRYYNNNDANQVGKGFNGGLGSNSVIRNCWVEHFECGAWIADYANRGSNNLLVEHCRFRNNYADGFNCAHNTNGHTIRYCSFRNNGDDDIASWSQSLRARNHTFAYCTAENNWRASSLGIFGGEGHTAHHLYIVDALESGLRVNSDFAGAGFSQNGRINIHDVTVQHCGCKGGTRGNSGDFWGSAQGAVNIGGTRNYPIYNVTLDNISVFNARNHALYLLGSGSNGNQCLNMEVKNIYVNGANYGILFSNMAGSATYCNLVFQNVNTDMNATSRGLTWTQAADCTPTDTPEPPDTPEQPQSISEILSGATEAAIYDTCGRRFSRSDAGTLSQGVYIILEEGKAHKICIF
ncbi:MAG: hypothetical protein IJ581_00110 [Paludibacteraceae bacterium]|nr:hypothetical protein [Paludibacteraceae bacterium]